MASDAAEVVILGAGIAGAALAYHLVRARVGPVVLHDPRTPAAGATGRAAGIVTEQLWDRWDVEIARETRGEYAELAARHAPGAYAENGFARWTRDPEIAAALVAAGTRLRGWGVEVEPLDGDELAARLPFVRAHGIVAASWSPHDGVVTPSALTEIYLGLARGGGAEVEVGVPGEPGRPANGRWELRLPGRTVRARNLVVAAGAWSKRLLQQLGHPLPLCPYRTQAAILRPPAGGPVLFPSAHDLDVDIYARPEENGRILAGDGTERVEADPETFRTSGDDSFVTHLAEGFEDRFPGWKDAELVRAWAGVCTATPDRRPLVGTVPGAAGLFVIAGFNGFGVMRAAGAARRLAELLRSGAASAPALGTVDPHRFAGRTGSFLPRPGFTLEAGDTPRF